MHSKKFNSWLMLGACGLMLGSAIYVAPQTSQLTVAQAASTSSIKVSQSSAVKKFNQKFPGKKVNSINLEKDDGRYVYSVTGFDQSMEYEAEINARTGKLIHSEKESLEDDDYEMSTLDTSKTISRSEATKIAEKAAKKGSAQSWELKQESSDLAIWEVEVKQTGHFSSKTVTINAQSKKVLNVEYDD